MRTNHESKRVLTSKNEMDTRQDCLSCRQSTVGLCEVALGESGGQHRHGMSDGIFADTTSNVHHIAQNQSGNQNSLKDVSHRFVYLDVGVTHGAARSVRRGRSEYICDRFSNRSAATVVEFRTIISVAKTRVYSMSPGKAQAMNVRFSPCSPYFAFHSVKVSQID